MGTEAIPICSSEHEPEVLHISKELPNPSKTSTMFGVVQDIISYPLTNSWSSKSKFNIM